VHVKIDRDKCIASGSCVLICPEVFEQDSEGVAVVLDEQPAEHLRSAVEEAAESCPSMCIDVEG
jgi:ferredoxin